MGISSAEVKANAWMPAYIPKIMGNKLNEGS